MDRTIAEHPIAYYQTGKGEKLRVSELIATAENHSHLNVCAAGVWRVMRRSWTAKFAPNILSSYEISQKVGTPGQQAEKIRRAGRGARYFITALGDESIEYADEVRAVLRIEQYQPKRPRRGNLLRQPYPNITDLETRGGHIAQGPYEADAAALMTEALRGADPAHKVAAYTEAANPDGVRFFETAGLSVARFVGERIGGQRMADGACRATLLPYVHMEAPQAAGVQHQLEIISRPFVPDV